MNSRILEDLMHSINTSNIRNLLIEVLGARESIDLLKDDDTLLGVVPELDSLAVANVIIALEDRFDIEIDEMDIQEQAFSSINALETFAKNQSS